MLITGLWLGSHSELPQNHFLPGEMGLRGRWMCLGKGSIPYTMLAWIPACLSDSYVVSKNTYGPKKALYDHLDKGIQTILVKGKMAGNTPKMFFALFIRGSQSQIAIHILKLLFIYIFICRTGHQQSKGYKKIFFQMKQVVLILYHSHYLHFSPPVPQLCTIPFSIIPKIKKHSWKHC